MHSERVLKALKEAGWYEGRCIDIEPYMAILEKLYPSYIPDVVKDVVREYGGLIITVANPDKNYDKLDLSVILELIQFKPYYSEDTIFDPFVNSDLFFIGEIWSGYFFLYMTPEGKVYADNGEILYLGNSFDEMLENVLDPNFRPEEISQDVHSEKVLKALKKAGWYEGRSVDIEPYVKVLLKLGHNCIYPHLQNMLSEYAGLKIEIHEPDSIFKEIDLTNILKLHPDKPLYPGCKISDPKIRSKLIYIGEIGSGNYLLYMTTESEFYAINEDEVLFLGNSFTIMLENVFTPNFKGRKW